MAAGSRRLARAVPARPARDDDESLRSPSRRQVSRDRRWAEILGVAGELMADSGTGALRLRDVAAQLGIRYQALYYYVDSKDELVHAVLREAIGRALAELRSVGSKEDPREHLAELLRSHVALTARERVLFRAFYERVDVLPTALRADLESMEHDYSAIFHDAVRAAISAGALPDSDPRVLTRALLGMATWTYRWPEELTPQQIDRAAHDMLRLVSLEP